MGCSFPVSFFCAPALLVAVAREGLEAAGLRRAIHLQPQLRLTPWRSQSSDTVHSPQRQYRTNMIRRSKMQLPFQTIAGPPAQRTLSPMQPVQSVTHLTGLDNRAPSPAGPGKGAHGDSC